MIETTVIHISEADQEVDVYIGRGSKWGNPFRIGKDGNRVEVIRLFETYLLTSFLMNDLHELVGKRIYCYCKPELCHGDILARYANQIGES